MNRDIINEHYNGDPSDPATERARERIHWICGQAKGQDILDIGCSQGIICLILGREGFRCTGIDIEPDSLNIGQQALAKEAEIVRGRVTFQVADASQLPFPDASFDTVMLGEILEHLTHPARVLAEAKRVLREGGLLAVTVPYGLNAFPDHKRTYYPLSLLELLQPLFKTRTVETLGNYITYTGAKDSAYDQGGISKEILLQELLRLEKALEERCLSKEQSLLETATRLYAQIKALNSQAVERANRISELERVLASRDKNIQDLQTSLEEARTSLAQLREGALRAEAESELQASRLRDLHETLAARESQIQDLERRLQQEHDSAAELGMKVLQAEAAQASLRAEATSAAAALAQMEQRSLNLQAENTQLRHDLAAKNASWPERLTQLEALHNSKLRDQNSQHQHLLACREAEWKRKLANQRVRDVARIALPTGAQVLVISKGDDDLLNLDGRYGFHFPQTTGGVYAGYHPADAAEAIKHLETLKARAEFLLIPASSFWWLDFYADFRRHLETSYRLMVYNEDCLIFSLSPRRQGKGQLALSFQELSARDSKSCGQTKSNHVPATPPAMTAPSGQTTPSPIPGGRSGADVAPLERTLVEPSAAVYPKPAQSPKGNGRSLPLAEGEGTDERERKVSTPKASALLEAPQRSTPPSSCPVSSVTQSLVSAVALEHSRRTREPGTLTVGCIFDEFTQACFRPECNLVTFRPDNWKSTLEHTPIDLLFIESAWQGNGGSWQYKIASFQRSMGEELVDLVNYCRSRKIPTAFWNKEDPPHFNRFIHRAPLFDHVFTSDADMIPKYCAAVKHNRVSPLPFAAQPELHHPIVESQRTHNVCFAGAYYAAEHDERRADMDQILRPALSFGLHIYDRQHGVVGTNAKLYQFPEIYQPAIKGRLEYHNMIKAYKWYKVFLNVNSVKRSPTMFSRRVFELLASGTPVISSYSKGIVELLGPNIVHLTNSEQETLSHLECLLRDEHYWAEISVKGLREVLSKHTYAHRMAEICHNLGLPFAGQRLPAVAAVVRLNTSEHVQRLIRTLVRQKYRNFDLTVSSAKAITKRKLETIRAALPNITVQVLPPETDIAVHLAQTANKDYLWLLSLDHYYGENFLQDAVFATVYSDPDIIGKRTHYELASGTSALTVNQPGHEFEWATSLSPGSVIAKAGKLNAEQWRAWAAGRAVDLPDLRVLAIDRFNFVEHAGGIGDTPANGHAHPLAKALL